MIKRRKFLKGLLAAPVVAVALPDIAWATPEEEEIPRCGEATEPRPEDHRHPVIPAGTILPVTNDYLPPGWLPCDGRLVSVRDFPALYAAIGQRYGVDDRTHRFRLPDMRGGYVTGGCSDNHNHSHRIDVVPSNHTHTINQSSHWHGEWHFFQPAAYLIKT